MFSVLLSVVKNFGIVNCALLSHSIVLADIRFKPHCAMHPIAAALTARALRLVPCTIHTSDFILHTRKFYFSNISRRLPANQTAEQCTQFVGTTET